MPNLIQTFRGVRVADACDRVTDHIERSFAKRWWKYFAASVYRFFVKALEIMEHHSSSLSSVLAGLALAAGAVIEKLGQLSRDLDHASRFGNDDHAP